MISLRVTHASRCVTFTLCSYALPRFAAHTFGLRVATDLVTLDLCVTCRYDFSRYVCHCIAGFTVRYATRCALLHTHVRYVTLHAATHVYAAFTLLRFVRCRWIVAFTFLPLVAHVAYARIVPVLSLRLHFAVRLRCLSLSFTHCARTGLPHTRFALRVADSPFTRCRTLRYADLRGYSLVLLRSPLRGYADLSLHAPHTHARILGFFFFVAGDFTFILRCIYICYYIHLHLHFAFILHIYTHTYILFLFALLHSLVSCFLFVCFSLCCRLSALLLLFLTSCLSFCLCRLDLIYIYRFCSYIYIYIIYI